MFLIVYKYFMNIFCRFMLRKETLQKTQIVIEIPDQIF